MAELLLVTTRWDGDVTAASDYLARIASAPDVEMDRRHPGPTGRSGDRGRREDGARPHRLHDQPRAGPDAVGVAR